MLTYAVLCSWEQEVEKNRRAELVKEKSLTMEYFLETRNLDQHTQDLLLKYDKDQDGTFSKDEVACIVLDLRAAQTSNEMLDESNRLYKRLLIAASVLFVFLLSGMFGLSYAVAVLTSNTDVRSDGTLLAKGSDVAIATDTRADMHVLEKNDAGIYCMDEYDVDLLVGEVLAGKKVIVEKNDNANGDVNLEQVHASGMVVKDDGLPCFIFPEQGPELKCLERSEECERQRRRLCTGDFCFGNSGSVHFP